MTDPTESPLVEAQADSLNDLFDRDPLELSSVDLERIVHTLRLARKNWEHDQLTGAKTPKAKAVVALADLDIEL